jgi:hypothetical protein
MSRIEDVRALLEALGDSPGTIASTLRSEGFTGDAYSNDSCILAEYLRAKGYEVRVSGRCVRAPGINLPLTPVLSTFIDCFDQEAWPELIA